MRAGQTDFSATLSRRRYGGTPPALHKTSCLSDAIKFSPSPNRFARTMLILAFVRLIKKHHFNANYEEICARSV
jgi:hypothetical protein